MDLPVLLALVSGSVIILLMGFVFIRFNKGRSGSKPAAGAAVQQVPRRAVAGRNARARLRAAAGHHEDEHQEDDDRTPVSDVDPEGKLGAKKRAKLEAKAERKVQREAEERIREDKRKQQQKLDEEKKLAEEKEKLEEAKREEEERKAKEEKERKEYEEYLKIKEAFTVEEEGFDESGGGGTSENLLQEFINYIKCKKVVVLEDLAAHFKLKTQIVIDRIQELQKNGSLTGVVDDRGKFIYISQEELEAVAKFVKQRGRVSLAELVENSNQLINLTPTAT